jgi:hypothetical protein
MAIRTTRWGPDTCQCILEYTWNDSLPQDQITTTFSNIVSACPSHIGLPSAQAIYNAVNEENPRKNMSLQQMLDTGPNTLYDIVNGNRQFKNGISVNFVWTGTAPNRVLTLTVAGITLTGAQRTTIQNALNTRFGVGKVVLT